MDHEFNRAANDSPRSGGSKRASPVLWAILLLVVAAATIWLTKA